MNILRSIYLCGVLLFLCASAYPYGTARRTYWIFFTDKGYPADAFIPGNDIYERTKAGITPKALARKGFTLTLEDADVFAPYIKSLEEIGIEPLSTSKWLNGITAMLTEEEVSLAISFPFVRSVEPAATLAPQSVESHQSPVFISPIANDAPQTPQAISLPCWYDSIIYHYGLTLSQLTRIGVPPLHAMGFDGLGVKIGFLDTGFNHEGMRTTRDRDIVETYDFVYGDISVTDDTNDMVAADGHGSTVLSAGVGYLPDSIVGPAFGSTIYLGKTEDLRSETPREEGYYAQALEWLWARGVDIASSSLGYLTYQPGFQSITYPMLDGKTTVAALAAIKAARRGMLVVTAVGNGGKDPIPYVMTPGDADSILAVGALLTNDSIADFSSRGPTFDGRIKPDICAPGGGVMTINRFDLIQSAGGTSLATPLVSSACALVMQTHPEASAQAIRSAVLKTGTRFGPPDTAYGYGRINAYAAALELGTIIGPHRQWRDDTIHHVCVGLAANNLIKQPRVVYAVGDTGTFSNSLALALAADSLIFTASFPPIRRGRHVRYYVETEDGADTVTRSPRAAPLAYYEFHVGDTIIKDPPAHIRAKASPTVSVFPNPVKDKFYVSSSYTEPIRYQLFDIAGTMVFQFISTTEPARTEVRLGSLTSGVYVLHGQLFNGQVVIRQTIVRLQ